MMTITIEMIDELRKRANVSFEDAKDALEKCSGDVVEALIYLEKNNKTEFSHCNGKRKFVNKAKELIRKANNTRFIVSKEDRTVMNLSLTVTLVICAIAFNVSVVALIVGLFTGYRYRLEKNGEEMIKANEVINKVHQNVDHFKKKFNEDVE